MPQRLGLHGNNITEEFIVNLEKYFPGHKWNKNQIRNRNARMLSFNTFNTEKVSKEVRFVDRIEKEFEHAVIAEYPDESLVVMRRKLCWDLSDILYLPLNVRKYPSKKAPLNPKLAEKVQNWNNVDLMLHRRFNESLWRDIQAYGQDFWDELAFYTKQQSRINEFCNSSTLKRSEDKEDKLKKILASPQYLVIPDSPWGKEYTIDPVWCLMNKATTMGTRNILRIENHPELCEQVERKSLRASLKVFEKPVLSNVTVMNPVYCSKRQINSRSGFQLPREVLEHPEIYEVKRH